MVIYSQTILISQPVLSDYAGQTKRTEPVMLSPLLLRACGERIGADKFLLDPAGMLAVETDNLYPFALDVKRMEASLSVNDSSHLALGGGSGA
mgnify:CR=1 FL=1